MTKLKGFQRRHLRALAHHLDPICLVGKNGVSDTLIGSIDAALDARELIKVKFNDCKPEKKELSALIEQRTRSHLVGLIGNIAILYRRHPDPEKRSIDIPES
jgi:RNA-binding protein